MITQEKLDELRIALLKDYNGACAVSGVKRVSIYAETALRVLNIEVEEPGVMPVTMSVKELLEHAIKYKYPVCVEYGYGTRTGIPTLDDEAPGRYIIAGEWYYFKNARSVERVREQETPPAVMPAIPPMNWTYNQSSKDWCVYINDSTDEIKRIADHIPNKANAIFLAGSKALAEAVIKYFELHSTEVATHQCARDIMSALEGMGCDVTKFRKDV